MKRYLSAALASALTLSAATAHAGGPVVMVEEPEVVAERPASSVGILPLLLVGVVLCAALCGGSDNSGDDDDQRHPPVGPPEEPQPALLPM
jgi:hypothetical protein